MVAMESDIISQVEVESPLQSEQQANKNHAFPSLGRQTSIYSLTLDEFQNTVCESGKNFGSMNMDEFLSSIWTAEENQAQAANNSAAAAAAAAAAPANNGDNKKNNVQLSPTEGPADKGIARQLSLSRQASITLPAPLCRKTVDEVWSEIHQELQQSGNTNVQNPNSTRRQPTFGEMTLEDFLVKAGVVREQCALTPPQPQLQQQPYGLYQTHNNPAVGPSFVSRPMMGVGGAGVPSYPPGGIGEISGYGGNEKRSGGYQPQPLGVCYGGRVGNGGGGYGQVQGLGMRIGSPASPVSSDGMCGVRMESSAQYGMEMGGMRGGRKRIIDGPVEKVVERRQRRMIKNRESAARSRARKQAYTVELEAELNQLREENAQLKQALVELERRGEEQHSQGMKIKAQAESQKANERLRMMRRNSSCPW